MVHEKSTPETFMHQFVIFTYVMITYDSLKYAIS